MEMSSSLPQAGAPGQGPGVAQKIMFVEDDAVVARIYMQKLTLAGFEVAYAEDGVEALRQMPGFKPDLVILDLVMPRMTGPDVLKFMRQNPVLYSIQVIVFSNSFLANQVEQVAAMGVDLELVKSAVTPAILVNEIHKVLGTQPIAEAAPAPAVAPAAAAPAAKPTPPAAGVSQPAPDLESDTRFLARIDRQFIERMPLAFEDLRAKCAEFLEAADTAAQMERLTALNRKLGFLIQIAAMSGCQRIAELAAALNALAFEAANQPALINDSVRQTIATTVARLTRGFDDQNRATPWDRRQHPILVVEPDADWNRVMVEALAAAQFSAIGTTDPAVAWKKLQETHYSVVLLEINLRGADGSAPREQIR